MGGGSVSQAAVKVAVCGFTGVDSLMSEAADSEDFEVGKLRIESQLCDDVRRFVEREVGDVGAAVDRLVNGNRNLDCVAGVVDLGLIGVVDDRCRRSAGTDARVEVAAVVARAANDSVGCVAGKRGRVEDLRILSRDAEGRIFAGLGHAETVLARPDEARNVVRVYGLRRHDVAGRDWRCPSCLQSRGTTTGRR